MSVDFVDRKEELKKREYNFKCKVIRKKVSFHDDAYEQDSTFQTAELVLLEPYEGTERDMFYTAYYDDAMPKKNGEGRMVSFIELPAWVSSPVSMPAMLRFQWPQEYYEKPHLFVMSYAIEKLLNTYKDVDTIDIRVFPFEKMEEMGLSDGVMRI